MNLCMTVSTFLAAIVVLRILFLMKDIAEIGNTLIMKGDHPPFTKDLLRGMPTGVVAYERFTAIHNQVLMIAASGGHKHKFNLCYKDPEVSKTIEVMVKEAFPDSALDQVKNDTCVAYKITW